MPYNSQLCGLEPLNGIRNEHWHHTLVGEDLVLDPVHAVEPTDWQTTEGEVEHKTWEWDPPSFQ